MPPAGTPPAPPPASAPGELNHWCRRKRSSSRPSGGCPPRPSGRRSPGRVSRRRSRCYALPCPPSRVRQSRRRWRRLCPAPAGARFLSAFPLPPYGLARESVLVLDVYFAALMAATKFHFDGPKALPLESARTLASPGPAVRRGVRYPLHTHETGRGGRPSKEVRRSTGYCPAKIDSRADLSSRLSSIINVTWKETVVKRHFRRI